MIIGHQRILSFFKTAAEVGTLSHAYGFFGPASVGKRAVAFEVASNLLGVSQEKLSAHPDFIMVERGEDEKTGKLKKEITVTQARELRARLQRTSWQGGYRIVVINEAEFLNQESGNALLKLLEEPPERSIFFLLIENENALLPTVRSRIQPFYFSLVSAKDIVEGLRARAIEPTKAEVFARRALGRPGRALQFTEEDFVEKYDAALLKFQEVVGAPLYKKIQLIESLYGDKEDGERGRQEWQRILDAWVTWFRDWLLKKHGATHYASEPSLFTSISFSNRELVEIIDALQTVKRQLQQNVHPRLAIETALLKF